jgi:hypothetical protein
MSLQLLLSTLHSRHEVTCVPSNHNHNHHSDLNAHAHAFHHFQERKAYRRAALKFHPDKVVATAAGLGEQATLLFQWVGQVCFGAAVTAVHAQKSTPFACSCSQAV